MKDLLNTPSGNKWKKIGNRQRAGVVVPLFSVYSEESLGIGDLADIKLLIDWCKTAGFTILQLLPMNEVGSTFCPYDVLSSFALEPAYISIKSIAASNKKTIKAKIERIKRNFPHRGGRVDYKIKKGKTALLRDIYRGGAGQESEEFKKFIIENNHWLEGFTLYKALKDYHHGLAWYEWEDRFKNRTEDALDAFRKEHEEEMAFQRWAQWVAQKQFKDAKAYAESKGIKLCGDLPILISRDSADVWAHPELFKLEYAAGAPPDMYCAKGQRWGMPPHNWERIAADGYGYIKAKLKYAENFYDILRVDHVVGLFRIWSIRYSESLEDEGLNGAFDPVDENRWKEHGRSILSMMNEATDMLLIAEDLGMIPKVCPATLEEFGIPGNDVQRWAKDWDKRHDFLRPEDYRMLSAAMLSTHDTTNWAAWWENEAGTVDEALFVRRSKDRGIDYEHVKNNLFDHALSKHGRLRWRADISSSDILVNILRKDRKEVADFIKMYEDTYREKEKLWKHLQLKGRMREEADTEIIDAALNITLISRSIFCIGLFVDYLYPVNLFKGDAYQYRINRPGTVNKNNWSLTMPISLEKLLGHKVSKKIKAMIISSGRI